ncbi:MAG: hypothetical protein E6H65_00870 [Betaproteobacteria bacterium]|nr:MAG: hypothetical protein E6H65_00870 [Betaproteobacteria bacterium]
MSIRDDVLLAYVDGELDAAARADVDAAIAADPQLAQRVQQQQALRQMLSATYDPVLDEPMPARLLAAARAPLPSRKVVDLGAERANRHSRRAPRAWPQWAAMAACLVVGVFAGRSALFMAPADEVATRGGQLVARGELAQSLSTQLASTQTAGAPVKIGVSFVSRADEFCRTFVLRSGHTAGLACRRGDDWQLRVLAQDATATADASGMRMAASSMPPAVLRAVDEQIQGGALDDSAERAALQSGWRKR